MHWALKLLVIIATGLGLTLIGAIIAVRMFWTPYWIPSGSMKPALLVGDYVLANDFTGTPKYGQIVTFAHPTRQVTLISRIVALPGDRVQVLGGILFLNLQQAPSEPEGKFLESRWPQGPRRSLPRCANYGGAEVEICVKRAFRETLPNGRTFITLNIGTIAVDNTVAFDVPTGHVFVMGDNRDNSTDSRISQLAGGVGFVPIDNIHGRTERVLFSSSGRSLWTPWTWRLDRFWTKIE